MYTQERQDAIGTYVLFNSTYRVLIISVTEIVMLICEEKIIYLLE